MHYNIYSYNIQIVVAKILQHIYIYVAKSPHCHKLIMSVLAKALQALQTLAKILALQSV